MLPDVLSRFLVTLNNPVGSVVFMELFFCGW